MRYIAAALLALGTMCGCDLAFSTVGSWTVGTPPPAAITTNHIVALADGRVGIFGGVSLQTGQASGALMLYDPAAGTWRPGAPMPGPAYPDVVARLHDGTVLVEGGPGPDGPSGFTSIYDPVANRWSQAARVSEPRSSPRFVVLADGRLLIAGGDLPLAEPITLPNGTIVNDQPTTTVEIFDPSTRAWSAAGRLTEARDGFALVALAGGGALAAGGCVQSEVFPARGLTMAEVFDGASSSWSATTPLPSAICLGTGAGLRDGRALLIDQTMFGNSSNESFLYEPKSRAWSAAGSLAGGGTTAVVLADGRVMVPETQAGSPQGHVFIDYVGGQVFDPTTSQWSYVTTTQVPLPLVYLFAAGTSLAVSLPDGTALVILQTVTLSFHPQVAPPPTQLLESTGLTTVLLALAVIIGLLMLLAYRRASRTDLTKLQ